MSDLKSFSVEMVKIAADDASKNYASRMVATLPIAIAKGFVDLPKGAVDKAVDLTIRTGKVPSLPKLVGRAVGRGGGTIGAGVFTTPMFFRGMKDLQNAKTKKERNSAAAKVLGAGFAYSAIKGAIETVGEKGLSGTKPKDIFRIAKNVGGVRGLIGVGSAALTAKAITSSRKKKDSKNRVFRDALAGGLVGAGKGALDELAEHGLRRIKTPKGIRGVAARSGGRVASGMIGAAALGKLFDSYMKKTSSEKPKEVIHTPYSLYRDTRSKSAKMPTSDVYAAYSAHIANGDPEKNPARRAVFYALTDTLRDRGQPVKPEALRAKVTPPEKPDQVGNRMLALALAPQAMAAVADRVSKKNDPVLKSAIEAQIAHQGISLIEKDPDSLWGHLTGFTSYSGGADVASRTIRVGTKATPEVLAHELGHLSAGPLRNAVLQNPTVSIKLFNALAVTTSIVPLIAVANASDNSFATKEELQQNKKVVDVVTAAGAVGMAPRILEEGLASRKATGFIYKALLDTGKDRGAALTEAVGRTALRLGPAYLTYLAPLLVGGAVSRNLSKRIEAKDDQ